MRDMVIYKMPGDQNDSSQMKFSCLDFLIQLHRARGRGGMNLGTGAFPQASYASDFTMNSNNRRNSKPMRGRLGGVGSPNRNAVQNSTTGHSIHMRGLPFEATLQDVLDFYAPLVPVDVRLLYESSGRPKGECDVDFSTHVDCETAMLKDKQNMGHRYIELFLKSSPQGNAWNRNNLNRSISTPQMNSQSFGNFANGTIGPGSNLTNGSMGPGSSLGSGPISAGPLGKGISQHFTAPGPFSNPGPFTAPSHSQNNFVTNNNTIPYQQGGLSSGGLSSSVGFGF